MTLGKRLKEAREALGLSQAALAEECGISAQAQLNFEKDRNLPGSAYLLELAELGVDVGYVLLGMRCAQTPEEAALLANYRSSSAGNRQRLLDTSHELASGVRQQENAASDSEPPARSIWAHIREERLRRGYATVKDLGRVTGISAQRLRALEEGSAKSVSVTELHALAAKGFDINFVLTGARADQQAMESDEAVLLANYRAASPELRAAALRLLGAQAVGAGAGRTISGGEQGQVVMGDQHVQGPMSFSVGGSRKRKG